MAKKRFQLRVEVLESRDTPGNAGSLDTTFGSGGIIITPFSNGIPNDIHTIVQLADGRFLAAGWATGTNQDFAVARYNADGTLDTSFGTKGYVTTDFGGDEVANAVAVQADGKIVVAGHTAGGTHGDLALARYNADGSLDSTFGNGGLVLADSGSNATDAFDDSADSLEIQGDKILVHGTRANLAIVSPAPLNKSAFEAQFNADGTLDPAFGTNGYNVHALPDLEAAFGFSSVLPLAGGKTLIVGSTQGASLSSDFLVKRYNADGTLDSTFGTAGKVVLNLGNLASIPENPATGTADVAYRAAVQADGKIIVVGSSDDGGKKFAVVRLNGDGSLDTSWGTGGIVVVGLDANADTALNVAVQSDGNVLVMGESVRYGGAQLAVARLVGVATVDPKPLPDPTPTPIPVVPAPVPSHQHWLVVGSDGNKPEVKVYDPTTGALKMDFMAYVPWFHGGVHVASGDINNDGVDDIITGAGTGGGPHVKVFDGVTGQETMGFMAYDPGFGGGVYVASGDVNGDGRTDIVTGAGVSGGPHVKVFDGVTHQEILGFMAYDPAFIGGVSVAAGDVNGDGHADIITGAGKSGGPHVRVYSGVGAVELPFGSAHGIMAFDSFYTGGVFVAAGDRDGDGHADIIVSQSQANAPQIHIYSGATGALVGGLTPFPARGDTLLARRLFAIDGARVSTVDRTGDGKVDIIVGAGPHRPASVLTYKGDSLALIYAFTAFDPSYSDGVFVG